MKERSVASAIVVVALTLFVSIFITAPSIQAAYPEPDKTIEFLHHTAPAGGAALFVLSTADILNKTGIVKNKIQTQSREGGSAAVALNYMKSRGGDPYLVMMWTTGPLMAMLRGATQLKVDECVWLSTLIEDGNVLIVPYNSPYKTLKDLIDDAKANPKKVSVGINSIGGSEHVMTTRIERATGAKFNITSFADSPTALIGGHISMAYGNTAETQGHVKAKRARVLANMSDRRTPYYKDIPTMIEQGYNASFTQVRGFFGGPGFPAEAVNYWQDAFAKMVKTPQYVEFMKKFDVAPLYKNSAETKAFLTDYVKALEEDLKFIAANK